MTDMPKFNFKPTISEADLKKEELANKPEEKFFRPGTHDVKILEASLNVTEANPTGRASGDASWLVIKLVLGGLIDKREIRTFVLVPTEDLLYKKPGMDKRYKLLMANKYREFLSALGENPEVGNLGNVLNTLFTDPSVLKGRVLKAVIGHVGNHLAYDPTTKTYGIVNKKEEPVIKRTYPDRDAAIAESAELGIELKHFPEVRRFVKK